MLVAAQRAVLDSVGFVMSRWAEAILDCDASEVLVTGGWRAGKSTVLAAKVLTFPRLWEGGALVWIVGPTYKAAHKETEYLNHWLHKSHWSGIVDDKQTALPSDGEQRIVLQNGSVIETRSAQHPERLASDAPDLLLAVEAGQMSPLVRNALLGRALEKDAQIVYGGTLENADEKVRFEWYEQIAAHWATHYPGEFCTICEDDGGKYRSFSLPSFSNRVLFPGGEQDPKIQRLKRTLDDVTYRRSVLGEVVGNPYRVYPQAENEEFYLRPMPPNLNFITAVGGADWGHEHPCALVVVSLSDQAVQGISELNPSQRHIAWVREVWWDQGYKRNSLAGDVAQFNFHRERLAKTYGARAWAVDPNERYMAGAWGAQAVSMGKGSRGARIGRVRARLNAHTLFFDLNGPGVLEAYRELQRVHYRKMPDGSLDVLRVDDDRTAALENAIDCLDGAFRGDFSMSSRHTLPVAWGKVRVVR